MKKSSFVILSLVIVAVAFISTFTGYIFGARANPDITDNRPIETEVVGKRTEEKRKTPEKEVKQAVFTQAYLVRDNNGRVAVYHKYSDGTEKLYKEYDISVNHLPQSDREALQKGVEVEALSDALQLIEDYS